MQLSLKSTYAQEIVDAEGQVPAGSICVHHKHTINVKPECVWEEQQDIAICDLGIRRSDVCINALDLDRLSSRLALMEITLEAAQVGWLSENWVIDVCHIVWFCGESCNAEMW